MPDLFMKEAAMYLRKSRAEELSDTTAEVLTRHREILAGLARSHSIVITDVYQEVVSGESIEKRPEMKRMLEAVRQKKYAAVLCMDIDRLGRGNMSDQGTLIELFQRSGTLIVTPDKIYDLNDEVDEELTEFKAFFARREWKMIRKRMRRGLMQTVEAGGYVANAPYGYRQCRVGKPPNDLPTLEIVPEEARFIEYIFSRYLSGAGAHIIADELNAMGSVPRRNAQWSNSTVRAIIRNPTYKGCVAFNRVRHYRPGDNGLDKHHVKYMPEEEWILVPGLHPAIISEADWERAQAIRKGRHIVARYDGHCKNSLAGLVVCARCGRKMQRMGDSDGHPRLVCPTKGCMPGSNHSYVEAAVFESLQDLLKSLRLRSGESVEGPSAEEAALLAGLEKELARLDARIPRLYSFFEDGVYDLPTFQARRAAAEAERAELLARREELAGRIRLRETQNLAQAAAALENVLTLWEKSDAAQRNRLLKSVVKKISYHKEKGSKPRDFLIEIEPLNFL